MTMKKGVAFLAALAVCLRFCAAASEDDETFMISFLKSSSFARGRAIDLITNQYTSSASPKKRIEDSFDAMKKIEVDGEPVPVKGHDFMFVGSVGASLNEKSIREHGITHVINWSRAARCNVVDGVDYLCFNRDHTNKSIVKHIDDLNEAVERVESVRKSGGRVLVHCWHGHNRSVTNLVSYLTKYEGMTATEATDLIKETRPKAKPWTPVIDAYAKRYLKSNFIRIGHGTQDEDLEADAIDWDEAGGALGMS